MKDSAIREVIKKLNNGKLKDQFFIKPVKNNVDFGYYWDDKPNPDMAIFSGDGPYKFYLIKNEQGQYTGAVMDMNRDLHWFIVPAFRKLGYLTKAMKSIILPHIFQSRTEQRITINSHRLSEKQFESSEAVALRLGFEAIGGDEYILHKKNAPKTKITEAKPKGLTEDRLEILRKRLNYLSRSLWAINNEVETSLGRSLIHAKMELLVEDIRKLTWKLEDAHWDFKEETDKAKNV